MFLRNVKCVHWLKNTAGYNIIIIVSNALIVTQNETRFRIWPQSDGELKKYIFRRSFDLILSAPFYIIKRCQIFYIRRHCRLYLMVYFHSLVFHQILTSLKPRVDFKLVSSCRMLCMTWLVKLGPILWAPWPIFKKKYDL